jgi:hypothetical protein
MGNTRQAHHTRASSWDLHKQTMQPIYGAAGRREKRNCSFGWQFEIVAGKERCFVPKVCLNLLVWST